MGQGKMRKREMRGKGIKYSKKLELKRLWNLRDFGVQVK
jgi:hypothetical protein